MLDGAWFDVVALVTGNPDDNVECVHLNRTLDTRVIVDGVANHFQISRASAFAMIHDRFRPRKVCARWASETFVGIRFELPSYHLSSGRKLYKNAKNIYTTTC